MNGDTNWIIMLSLIEILVSIFNVLYLYLSVNLEAEFLDAHKMIAFFLRYR